MLTILSLLLGYSFMQAVNLFSQASQTALTYPALAGGMNPLEGIFVPTFGAYYLIETLLLPFVIIHLIGQDKQNGTLKLLLQLPLSPAVLNLLKLAAVAGIWLLILLPGISVFITWQYLGGAIYLPEILCLLLGHTLYALIIVSIAMFATSISDSLPTAAMICLAATLGSWVLDFAAGSGGWLGLLGSWSFTTQLRQFENGLLSTNSIVYIFALALFFFISASIWIHPGHSHYHKLKSLFWAAVILLVTATGIMQVPSYLDVTENHKHSFNPADTRALKEMKKPLKITIHLTREDGRFYDFNHEILVKLCRIVPHLQVVFSKTRSAGLFGAAGDENYGLIEYDYDGRHEQSYSNSTREILPLLHALAGQEVKPDKLPDYTGHPLVTDARNYQWWFYLALPLIFLFAAWKARR
jgi:ABC-type transport system involved in multi-copper enzyme maturation permease subunit